MAETMKEPKEVKVDKDFLFSVLKKLDDLEKKIFELTQLKSQEIKIEETIPMVKSAQDYAFECSLFLFNVTSANELQRKAEADEFKKESEGLMKKYKVGRVLGTFIKAL